MGVSFAIPIDIAMEVANQLRTDGRVSRGYLGVMIQEVSRDLAESFGLDRPHGALIAKVIENAPAAAGGLREGDVITKFAGRSIERSSELPHFVGRVKAGDKADVELVRDGEKMTLEVVVGELADLREDGSRPSLATSTSGRLGLAVAALSDDEMDRLGLTSGVRVVGAEGAAADAGVSRGDVITRLNNQPVDDPNVLNEIVEALPEGRTVPMLVLRNGNPVFLAIKVPE